LLLGTVFAPQTVPLIFSLIVIPVMFLGCTYYPWKALEAIRWLQILVLINPLVYVSEGLRGALTPQVPHMSAWVTFGALTIATLALGISGTRSFRRRLLS
jgi:ABC-2 type transport system permease protein